MHFSLAAHIAIAYAFGRIQIFLSRAPKGMKEF
jgi:hypothetical protein